MALGLFKTPVGVSLVFLEKTCWIFYFFGVFKKLKVCDLIYWVFKKVKQCCLDFCKSNDHKKFPFDFL